MIEIAEPLEAYKELPGPILLLAGPGTGKTYQLAKRVEFLVNEREVSPNEISVITFTNEAARNMRERLDETDERGIPFLPREKQPENILTMNSLGNRIIGSHPEIFGLTEDFSVLHESGPKEVLLRDACIIIGLDTNDYRIIDKCRGKGHCNEDTSDEKCKACHVYRSILRKCSMVDFNDQILLVCKALQEHDDLRNSWQQKTRYLLVDEYQDVNYGQYELIRILASGQEDGLFAVGDDDQSIYSFRGGDPSYIRDFETHYGPNYKIGRLSKSWRCPKHILKGGRLVIGRFFPDSVPKPDPTFSDQAESEEKIHFYNMPSAPREAGKIASIAKEKQKSSSIIVIIPTKDYFPLIRDALSKVGVDYRFKRKTNEWGLKRFLALSEWIVNQNDNEKLRYLLDLIVQNHDELTRMVEISGRSIIEKRKKADRLIAEMWNQVSDEKNLFQVITELAEQDESPRYIKELKAALDDIVLLMQESGNSRRGTVPFLKKCGQLVAPGKKPIGLIDEIETWKEEITGSGKTSSYDPVQIYTMQSSKGLEADVVMVVGLTDGIIPKSGEDTAEQCRLFYVAATRAKSELYLFHSRSRSGGVTHGESFQLTKSPFIDAIPTEHLDSVYFGPARR